MKCATTTLLVFLGVTASCQAFVTPVVVVPSTTTTTTALAGYHYTNSAEPDPSSTASSEPKKGKLEAVFPTYATPQPKAPLDKVGEEAKKKGLNPVFLDWEDRGFSADGLQRPSS